MSKEVSSADARRRWADLLRRIYMEKTIGPFEVRRRFGKMLTDILTRGDRFVVERHGEPVAVVVPIQVYQQWKQSRDAFFDEMEAAAAQAKLTPEAAAALADEAIRDVRDGR